MELHKAEKVCSNSQLYKQAGNSIVVNVLEGIFRKLFIEKTRKLYKNGEKHGGREWK